MARTIVYRSKAKKDDLEARLRKAERALKAADAALNAYDHLAIMYVQHRCNREDRSNCRPETPLCKVWEAINRKNDALSAYRTERHKP